MDQKAHFHSALDRRLFNTPADAENWLLPLARLKASCLQHVTTTCPGLYSRFVTKLDRSHVL